MAQSVTAGPALETQLRQALDNGAFVLHYQPMVTVASGGTLRAAGAPVSTIVSLTHALKPGGVADGAGSDDRSRLLPLPKCDEMQGNRLRKAAPREVFETPRLALSATI
ncbi:MAG: hypothetical protein WA900_10960 [Casimicrobiaceae bacterium]